MQLNRQFAFAWLLWNALLLHMVVGISIINTLYCILNKMIHHSVQCFSYLETDFAISFMWPHNYKAFISCEYSDSQVNKIFTVQSVQLTKDGAFTGLNKTTIFSTNFQSLEYSYSSIQPPRFYKIYIEMSIFTFLMTHSSI